MTSPSDLVGLGVDERHADEFVREHLAFVRLGEFLDRGEEDAAVPASRPRCGRRSPRG
jgi:hypothetical protein